MAPKVYLTDQFVPFFGNYIVTKSHPPRSITIRVSPWTGLPSHSNGLKFLTYIWGGEIIQWSMVGLPFTRIIPCICTSLSPSLSSSPNQNQSLILIQSQIYKSKINLDSSLEG